VLAQTAWNQTEAFKVGWALISLLSVSVKVSLHRRAIRAALHVHLRAVNRRADVSPRINIGFIIRLAVDRKSLMSIMQKARANVLFDSVAASQHAHVWRTIYAFEKRASCKPKTRRRDEKLQKQVFRSISRDSIKMQATCAPQCHKDQALCAKHLELCAQGGEEGKSLSHFTSFSSQFAVNSSVSSSSSFFV
jgi:hypothetical protein